MTRRRLAAALLCGLALLAAAPGLAAPTDTGPVERYRQALTADPDNPTLHYLLGIALLNADRNAEALTAFQNAYPAYRTSIEANFNLSLTCLRLNDLDAALLYFDQAENLGIGDHAEIYPVANLAFNLALRAHESGQANEAIRLFHRVLAYDPARAEVYRQLGGLHAQRGDDELARKAFRQHLALVPDDPVSRDYLFALEFNRAQDALQNGDQDMASQGFATSLELKPDHPAVLYYLGYLAYQQQRPDEAARLLQQAFPTADRELRAALRPLLYNCSLALRDSGRPGPALTTALVLAEQPDANSSELFLAGSLSVKNGRHLEGKILLERVLALEPGHAGALQNLITAENGAFTELVIRIRQAINDGDYALADESLATARNLQPASSQLSGLENQLRRARLTTAGQQFATAHAALAAGDHAAARKALQQGLSTCPEGAEGNLLREQFIQEFASTRDRQLADAQSALAAGRWNEAHSAFTALLALDPAHAEAQAGLQAAEQGRVAEIARLLTGGQQALAGKQPAQARDLFTALLALAPDDAAGKQGLADAEHLLSSHALDYLQQGRRAAAQGRLEDARSLFEKARLIDDDGTARGELARLDQAIGERFNLLLNKAGQAAGQGNYRQAEQLYTQALTLKPDNEIARQGRQSLAEQIAAAVRDNLAKGDEAMRRDDLPTALAAYRRTLDLAPDSNAAQTGLQRIRQRQDERLNRLVARGGTAFAAGDLNTAAQAVDQALKLDPYHPDATRLRERIEQARLGGASPGDEQSLYLQGVALYTKGNYSEAIRLWEMVLTLNPDFEKARQNIDKTRRKLRQIEEYRGG